MGVWNYSKRSVIFKKKQHRSSLELYYLHKWHCSYKDQAHTRLSPLNKLHQWSLADTCICSIIFIIIINIINIIVSSIITFIIIICSRSTSYIIIIINIIIIVIVVVIIIIVIIISIIII